jgi:hypothetical protein
MQVTYPDLWGDLGDQIPAAELILGIRRPLENRPGSPERKAEVIEFPEFDYISPAELMAELVGFMIISPRLECQMRNELAPGLCSRLMQQLTRVWAD